MKHSYRSINVDHDRFNNYLTELREHRAWEKIPIEAPYGSENKMLVAETGKCLDEIMAEIETAKQKLRVVKVQSINAETPDLLEPHRPLENLRNKNRVTKVSTDDASYAHARLRRDRPDIHQRVLDGELSAHAGMVQAGFRKRAARAKPTAFDKVLRAVAKLTDQEWRKLVADEDRRRRQAV
jgi:hypothetical protein